MNSIKNKEKNMYDYLDYNATAPIHKSVVDNIQNYPQGNPSSVHTVGKQALKQVNITSKYLFKTFNLNDKRFNLFYHSGATEGINTILGQIKDSKGTLVYSEADHPAVLSTAYILETNGVKTFKLNLDNLGQVIELENLLKNISNEQEIWVNITWMHNETGVVQDLRALADLKKKYRFYIHVDAVQSVGKVKDWSLLSSDIDAYTFSGHKFGALKGIGFSFISKDLQLKPLIVGGSQQKGLRSGTVNTHGILSLLDALKAEVATVSGEKILEFKNKLIDILKTNNQITLIENDSFNTICFLHHTKNADEMLIHFDLADLCVSSGSACSAGSVEESKTLLEMGYKDLAKNSIRISLGYENLNHKERIISKLEKVLTKLS